MEWLQYLPCLIFPLFFLGIVGVVIYAIIYGQKLEKERAEKLKAVAEELGMKYHPDGAASVVDAFNDLELFNWGRNRKFTNMIYGNTRDVSLALTDYRFTTGSGKNKTTHHQSVACIQSGHLHLPDFELRPENFLHKIGKVFGYQDINFASHPRFSGKYLLRGPDAGAIQDFFTPELLEFLEQEGSISIEGSGDRLIYYKANRRHKPEEINQFLEDAYAVYRQFRGASATE